MTTLSVVQYNTLADALCTGDDAGFTSLPPEKLAWCSRGEALVRALRSSDADVLCLQEVDHYYDTLLPALAACGYAGCFREDEWSSCRKLSRGLLRDGVAIFYKREKLELCGMHVPCTPREAKDVPAVPGGDDDADDDDHHGATEDAGKCLIARFRVLPPREMTHGDRWKEHTYATEEVVVATVHLDSKKNEEGVAKRRRQAAGVAREVRAFRDFSCSNPATAAVVVAGDLNAKPDEPAVAIFKTSGGGGGGICGSNDDDTNTTASARVEKKAKTTSSTSTSPPPLKMFSAYERASGSGSEPPFTTWKFRTGSYKPGEAKMTIDYVFVSEGCEVVEVGKLDDEDAIGPKGLPSEEHPSDHLMLRATVRLPPPPPGRSFPSVRL